MPPRTRRSSASVLDGTRGRAARRRAAQCRRRAVRRRARRVGPRRDRAGGGGDRLGRGAAARSNGWCDVLASGGRRMTRHARPARGTIVAATRAITEVRRERRAAAALERRAAARDAARRRVRGGAWRSQDASNVIAECKRRSPSRACSRPSTTPSPSRRQYEAGGAAAISVLTEPTFFDGALEHLAAVRAGGRAPAASQGLHRRRVSAARGARRGADAVLLIVAALEQADLVRLQRRAWELGLAALVEVHDDEELSARDRQRRADHRREQSEPAHAGGRRGGVATGWRARIPADVVGVSESGLTSRARISSGLRGRAIARF